MSRRISDGLRHRSWAATTEEEEEEKNMVVLQGSRSTRTNEIDDKPLSRRRKRRFRILLPPHQLQGKKALQSRTEIQEADSNSVSSSDSNILQVVSGTPPVEQEVVRTPRAKSRLKPSFFSFNGFTFPSKCQEREKTSATGDQDSAITEELKQATKFAYFATSTTEELKQATKFSYFATALAGGGILSLLIFHLENNSGEPHTLFFKALTSVLATFVSGLSIILLIICATLVFLALMGVGVSIVLIKIMSELTSVPAIVVVIVACIIVHCKKSTDLINIDRDGRGLSNHHPCVV